MTNEEAIYQLKEINKEAHIYSDAVDMAIKALMEQSKHDQNTSSKQPDLETLGIKTGETCADAISRQAAIDAFMKVTSDGDEAEWCKWVLEQLPSVQPEQRWIPCSEMLPEEDVKVLITYRYKEGEGDTSHAYIDITTYGQMYFGGNKVGDYKHWREPFEYFTSNYEVVAWMPLPEPYKGES